MRNVLLVFLGGGLGSVLRYWTILGVQRWVPTATLPWGVLAANVVGSFLLGLLLGLPAERMRDSSSWLFLTTGVLGGYTTFSTLANDSWVLFAGGRTSWALANALCSLVLGVIAAAAGWHMARSLQS